jgi:hypothetical protein
LGAFPALLRKAPETGLSAPIFFAGAGKKVFPLLSLARRQPGIPAGLAPWSFASQNSTLSAFGG